MISPPSQIALHFGALLDSTGATPAASTAGSATGAGAGWVTILSLWIGIASLIIGIWQVIQLFLTRRSVDNNRIATESALALLSGQLGAFQAVDLKSGIKQVQEYLREKNFRVAIKSLQQILENLSVVKERFKNNKNFQSRDEFERLVSELSGIRNHVEMAICQDIPILPLDIANANNVLHDICAQISILMESITSNGKEGGK